MVLIVNTETQVSKEEMMIRTKAQCVECLRVFDLLDETDADEWAYGHDCEV